jgi:glycolate oxidase
MADVVAALRAGIPDGSVIDDPDRMESYRYDKALFCPAGKGCSTRQTRRAGSSAPSAAISRQPPVPCAA